MWLFSPPHQQERVKIWRKAAPINLSTAGNQIISEPFNFSNLTIAVLSGKVIPQIRALDLIMAKLRGTFVSDYFPRIIRNWTVLYYYWQASYCTNVICDSLWRLILDFATIIWSSNLSDWKAQVSRPSANICRQKLLSKHKENSSTNHTP